MSTYTQFPKVETSYTYLWEGEEALEIGDYVRVPGSHFKPNPQVLKVIAMDPDYVGPLVNVIEKIECTCEEDAIPFCYYHPNA